MIRQAFGRTPSYLLLAILLLQACSSTNLSHYAQRHNMVYDQISGGNFQLSSLSKPPVIHQGHVNIYLGSDGRPWEGRSPSKNPTGKGMLSQNLLLNDPQGGLYLSRPCYFQAPLPANCRSDLWTSARYGSEVVASMKIALTTLLEQLKPRTVTLIGYSGGGVIALLLAQQALPVPSENITVITVASNLDIDAWTQHHGHLPLRDSINPLTLEVPDTSIRRFHLIAGQDKIVPPSTLQHYREKFPHQHYLLYKDYDHSCCWLQQWPTIITSVRTEITAAAPVVESVAVDRVWFD